MRISTNQYYQIGLYSILDQQAGLIDSQSRVSTGLRVNKPSDDPIATVTIVNLEQEIARTERYTKNIETAMGSLAIEDATLQKITETLQRTRELILSGGNATYGDDERESLAVEMDGLLDQVLGFANSRNTNGDYMFAGNRVNITPFTQNVSGSYNYNGDQGVREVQISSSTRIKANDSGYSVFQNIRNGNGDFQTQANVTNTGSGIINAGTVTDQTSYVRDTFQIDFVDIGGGVVGYDVTDSGGAVIATNVPYVDGDDISFNGLSVSIDGSPDIGDNFSINPSIRQDLFTTIQESIATLRINVSTPADAAYLNNQLQNSLINLDQAMQNIGFIQAQVGTRLNIAESQKFINEDFNLTSKTTLSTIRDLDMAEAISDLNFRSISLEAAQASFARVQNLSLFNFLR